MVVFYTFGDQTRDSALSAPTYFSFCAINDAKEDHLSLPPPPIRLRRSHFKSGIIDVPFPSGPGKDAWREDSVGLSAPLARNVVKRWYFCSFDLPLVGPEQGPWDNAPGNRGKCVAPKERNIG